MIGILADTHDNLEAIRKAVELLNNRGVKVVIHAGDFVAPFVAKELSKLGAEFWSVFGNNDGEREGLRRRFSESGLREPVEVLVTELLGLRVFVYHGTSEVLLENAISAGKYDLVAYGHTHRPRIERVGRTLVVNPGEACGYLSGKRTLALLSPKGEAEILEF